MEISHKHGKYSTEDDNRKNYNRLIIYSATTPESPGQSIDRWRLNTQEA